MSIHKTKIDESWERIFDDYHILDNLKDNTPFLISSKKIKEYHEPRLMAKFDQFAQLPKIFRDNKLSILPVTRGNYIIGPFETHKKIKYNTKVEPIQVKDPQLETLKKEDLNSEAAVLHFAYNSGIIADAMNSNKIDFTVSGRMGSGDFSFYIENSCKSKQFTAVNVKNSQIEIDAGFESPDTFFICEAKNYGTKDMLIRQLYYPYRLWKKKISKPVIPVFLTYSDEIFNIFIFDFENVENYNSIILKEHKKYTFAEENIPLQDIVKTWRSTKVIVEPNENFPQANTFPRIIDLLSALREDDLTLSEVAMQYEFVARQAYYYTSACEYLGLVKRESVVGEQEPLYCLTVEGRKIMSLPYKERYLNIIKKILEKPIFNKVFNRFIENNNLPDEDAVSQIIRETDLPRPIDGSTVGRRAQTVRSWLKWMIKITSAE